MFFDLVKLQNRRNNQYAAVPMPIQDSSTIIMNKVIMIIPMLVDIAVEELLLPNNNNNLLHKSIDLPIYKTE